jgi:hypothetical protein
LNPDFPLAAAPFNGNYELKNAGIFLGKCEVVAAQQKPRFLRASFGV